MRYDDLIEVCDSFFGQIRPQMLDMCLSQRPEFAVMEQYGRVQIIHYAEQGENSKPLFISAFISDQTLHTLMRAEPYWIAAWLSKQAQEKVLAFCDLLSIQWYSQGKGTDWDGIRAGLWRTIHKQWEKPFSFAALAKVLPSWKGEEIVPYLGTMSPQRFARLQKTAPLFSCFAAGDTKNEIAALGFPVVRVGAVDCVSSGSSGERDVFLWRKDTAGMRLVDEAGDILGWIGFAPYPEKYGMGGHFLIGGNFSIVPESCWRLSPG